MKLIFAAAFAALSLSTLNAQSFEAVHVHFPRFGYSVVAA